MNLDFMECSQNFDGLACTVNLRMEEVRNLATSDT